MGNASPTPISPLKQAILNHIDSKERALLVGVELYSSNLEVPLEDSLEELEQLAVTAGARVIGKFTQRLKKFSPATLIGRGKVDEIQAHVLDVRPDLVIVDENLSPAQQRNLEDAFKIRVIDRSQLILDIFSQRAKSKEGKLQVELAQLEYLLPRLTRQWSHLSRIAGGIGTRGPGETQLEVDRRRVRERIGLLRKRLTSVKRTRDLHRHERLEVPYATIALVGYTNSGKSTLMNALTRAGVIAEDKLFATLDPTTRSLRLPSGDKVMVVDTVGFSHKIPHSLIEAFKSTLEEVTNADLLLHVVDMTSPLHEKQIQVVESVLREIGAGEIRTFMVPNKTDLLSNGGPQPLMTNGACGTCPISALTGTGIHDLLESVGKILDQGKERAEFVLSSAQGPLLSLLRQRGRILEEKHEGGAIHVIALLSPKLRGQMKKWLNETIIEAAT